MLNPQRVRKKLGRRAGWRAGSGQCLGKVCWCFFLAAFPQPEAAKWVANNVKKERNKEKKSVFQKKREWKQGRRGRVQAWGARRVFKMKSLQLLLVFFYWMFYQKATQKWGGNCQGMSLGNGPQTATIEQTTTALSPLLMLGTFGCGGPKSGSVCLDTMKDIILVKM